MLRSKTLKGSVIGTRSRARLRRVLGLIPADTLAFLLASDAGHTTHELAPALACSAAAVRLRLFRARERFRKIYLQECASSL